MNFQKMNFQKMKKNEMNLPSFLVRSQIHEHLTNSCTSSKLFINPLVEFLTQKSVPFNRWMQILQTSYFFFFRQKIIQNRKCFLSLNLQKSISNQQLFFQKTFKWNWEDKLLRVVGCRYLHNNGFWMSLSDCVNVEIFNVSLIFAINDFESVEISENLIKSE